MKFQIKKKEIAKAQQQLTDMERKESEYKRNAAAAATRYQQSCEELGIQGNDVKAELKALGKALPAVFMDVVKSVCNNSVGESLELYQAFVSYAHQEAEEDTPILPTLRELRENPPKLATPEIVQHDNHGIGLNYSECILEEHKSLSRESCKNDNVQSNESNIKKIGFEGANDSIDWSLDHHDNIGVASVGQDGTDQIGWGIDEGVGGESASQIEGNSGIDWGIDTVSDGLPSGEGSKLGSDINWDIGIVTPQPETSPDFDFVVLQQDLSAVDEGVEKGGEINWDIDLDESDVDGAHQIDNMLPEVSSIEQEMGVGRFLETKYSNMLLNDLFELRAFVKQRVEELERQETAALQNQVQAMAPTACFQHGSGALNDMALHITAAIDLLTAQKTRDLCLLVTSSRFLDRLYSSLLSKKETETKLLASLKDLCQRRAELRNSLTLLWPKQESALKRTREVKEYVQDCISTLYERRPVNIIGTINTVLGLA